MTASERSMQHLALRSLPSLMWTPDEKYLVHQSGNAQQSDIWLLPMQTGFFRRQGKPIRLTNGPLPYTSPLPSRDGKQIFVLGTKGRRTGSLRYEVASVPAVFLWNFGNRSNILPG